MSIGQTMVLNNALVNLTISTGVYPRVNVADTISRSAREPMADALQAEPPALSATFSLDPGVRGNRLLKFEATLNNDLIKRFVATCH